MRHSPLLVCNVAWMKLYKGLRGDSPIGGGAYVRKHGYGHEVNNHFPLRGWMYGYVKPPGERIDLSRLGAASSATSVAGITVVWTARDPHAGGVFVVGWYSNATVFRDMDRLPRQIQGTRQWYNIKAREQDCRLLEPKSRILQVPMGKGGKGQSNVWYADGRKGEDFKRRVLALILRGGVPAAEGPKRRAPSSRTPRQVNPKLRRRVEVAAIDNVTEHWEDHGYRVHDGSAENKGWDLEAIGFGKSYRLEVKGLSGSDVSVELTPNEYATFRRCAPDYQLCVVTQALHTRPDLRIFSYQRNEGGWADEDGEPLRVQPRVAARLTAP